MFDSDSGVTVSNGGLNAPMADMARYLAFLIGDQTAPAQGVQRTKSLEEMWTPPIRAADGEGGNGTDVQAGAVQLRRAPGRTSSDRAQRKPKRLLSHLYLHRPSRSAYVVAFNTDASSKSRGKPRITRDVDDTVRDRVVEIVSKR